MADLARRAEEAGWDAIFLEDYIVYPALERLPTYDSLLGWFPGGVGAGDSQEAGFRERDSGPLDRQRSESQPR